MTRRWGIRGWTRHSLILIFAGIMYIGIGVAFLNTPKIYAKDPSLKIALQWLTFDQWGWVYISCGLASMLSSLWPIGSEKWGYTVLSALSSAWSAFYLLAVIFVKGVPKLVLIQALLWGILAFIWWAVSGLISPQGLKTVVPSGPD